MLLTSYLIGLGVFCLTRFALDRKKEKKRLFKSLAFSNEEAKSKTLNTVREELYKRFGLTFDFENPTPLLATVHLLSLGLTLACGLSQMLSVVISVLAPVAVICYAIGREKRRAMILEAQVEPLLTSITNSLYGNPGIANALREAESGASEPMKKELARALAEIDHGCDINKVMEGLASRINSEVFSLAVDGFLICRETGGNLSNLLEGLSSVARTRANLKGKIKALTAQQKTTATFVAVIPIAFVLFSQAFSPVYQESLKTPTGVGVTMYALVSVAIGFVWLNRMTDVFGVKDNR